MLLDLLTIIIHYLYICAKVIAKCCVNFVIIALEMSNDIYTARFYNNRINVDLTDNYQSQYNTFIIKLYQHR